jgi:hypothetical protein
LRRARTLDGGIAASTAGAHVHRPDELEARREERVPTDAGYQDHTVLEWLPQRLQHRAREFRKLVQEEHAAVRQRDLPGPRTRSAADDRGRRGAVVWSTERRDREKRSARRQHPRDRMDARDFERLRPRECRQDAGKATGEHRLAGTGWSHEEEVVRACGRNLERASRALLPADVGEIGRPLP